jgi:hypothetical protein
MVAMEARARCVPDPAGNREAERSLSDNPYGRRPGTVLAAEVVLTTS